MSRGVSLAGTGIHGYGYYETHTHPVNMRVSKIPVPAGSGYPFLISIFYLLRVLSADIRGYGFFFDIPNRDPSLCCMTFNWSMSSATTVTPNCQRDHIPSQENKTTGHRDVNKTTNASKRPLFALPQASTMKLSLQLLRTTRERGDEILRNHHDWEPLLYQHHTPPHQWQILNKPDAP